MKSLFISCEMGAAGDMLTGALVDLFEDKEAIVGELNALGIPSVVFSCEELFKCGIRGTHLHVYVNGEEEHEHVHEDGETHVHNSMHSIEHIVNDQIRASDEVKHNVMGIYNLLADAESRVHGVEVSEIHFHEVGNMDAIADITAFCYLMEKLGVKKLEVSPIHVGMGTVRCAHGILPVPAPATAILLEGFPTYSDGKINGELCTPTGAAILRYFATGFERSALSYEKVGYGMGTKDFPQANCVRVFLSDNDESSVIELDFNVDDMTGEEAGFAMEKLFEEGAREVFITSVYMKKNRPGLMFHVLCLTQDREKMIKAIFKHTTTIGIRESFKKRYTLDRENEEFIGELGRVRIKSSQGYGTAKAKIEYEDLAAIARENDLSLSEVRETFRREMNEK